MTPEELKLVIQMAREHAAEHFWCLVCEVTIGNGDMAHAEDCPLYLAEDEGKS